VNDSGEMHSMIALVMLLKRTGFRSLALRNWVAASTSHSNGCSKRSGTDHRNG
jgi:hypothetical protein